MVFISVPYSCTQYSVMATKEVPCGIGLLGDSPETSVGSHADLECFTNTLVPRRQTFLCDEGKIGALSILNESHLCMVLRLLSLSGFSL